MNPHCVDSVTCVQGTQNQNTLYSYCFTAFKTDWFSGKNDLK